MTSDRHSRNKAAVTPFRRALYDYDPAGLKAVVTELFAPHCRIRMSFPFEEVAGPEGLLAAVYGPLAEAIPDLERRDTMVIAGSDGVHDWVGCGGYYTGIFAAPWLGIPPTCQQVSLRFHEFFRMRDGRVAEVQALWDIPEVMMQAGVWPMSPSLGLEWHVPGPATQDGILGGPRDEAKSNASAKLVEDMLAALKRHASGGVAAMELDRYWHPKMNWYGPAGIGTSRQIVGFRRAHQIPFLNAMPDRRRAVDVPSHLFGDGDYVGFTAWPGLAMTLSGDGWLGIAPAGQEITMRSLDFWRCEAGLIRENWVLVDLLHVYHQLGVNVFQRMTERTPAYRDPFR
ncbi:ester cyclase [Pelagibius sp.]|uniref:ester cyclase n=1 Tax=Pelagibius sp. TaxID=1931238 RepID=UPI00261D0F9E|nr:ester cyclase [Pelagibius sp.]